MAKFWANGVIFISTLDHGDKLSFRKCLPDELQVRLARRRRGIEPNLPPEKDRPSMKLKYAQTGQIPLTPD